MWSYPKYQSPKIESPFISELNEDEQIKINGGSVGTCYVVGYTCDTDYGGIKAGTCLIVGYSCDTSKGGI